MNAPSPPNEEEYLDLRELFLSLWEGKWKILALGVAFWALAAILSFWGMTPQYQASAFVVVKLPRVPSTISYYIPTPYSIPDLNTLIDTLQGDIVLQKALQGETGLDLPSLRAGARAEIVGRRGIRLTVRDTDPQRAARLANRWASLVEDQIRAAYGLENMEKQWNALVNQHLVMAEDWSTRIEAFEHEHDTILSSLAWQRLQNTYTCLYHQQNTLETVQKEVRRLRSQLNERDDDFSLPPEKAALIWSLTSKDWQTLACQPSNALGGGAVMVPPPAMTAQEARTDLNNVERTITTALADIQTSIAQTKEKVRSVGEERNRVAREFEHMVSQQTYAWSAYMRLKEQSTWFQAMQQKGALLREVQAAKPPTAPTVPRPKVNMAVGILLGLIVGSMVVLIQKWWLQQEAQEGDTP